MPLYVVKNALWPRLGYSPHLGQQEVHDSMVRHRVLADGRRWGKTIVGGRELVPEAAKTWAMLSYLQEIGKRRRFWIVGPDYSDVNKEFRVLWYDLKRLQFPFDSPGSYYNIEGSHFKVSLFNGFFEVEGKSAKNLESLDGEGLSGVLLVEAGSLKNIVFDQKIRPALADERGWSLITGTPKGKNWFYKKWQNGQNPKMKAWQSWRKPSWENPYIFPEGRMDPEILEMETDMSAERFAQEVEAKFTDFVGRVFKDFDEELHVIDVPYRADLPLFLAIDYGWTNPFVALAIQVDVFKNVYVIGEYRVTNRDINEIGRDLKRDPMFGNASIMFPDPAEPGDTAVLQKLLRCKVNTNTGGELKWRLELIRKQLKYDPASEGHPDDARLPQLFIDRSCVGNPLGDGGLIREMIDYRYPETKEESLKALSEMPMDKDDHGPEALGRFFRGYFGGPGDTSTGGRARIRKARVAA